MTELDELVERIGRLCDDPACQHCTTAAELANRVHGYPAGTNGYNNHGCRCSYCRNRHAGRKRKERARDGIAGKDKTT